MGGAIINDVFGRLEWDDRLGGWLGGIDWPPGRHTEVVIWQPGTDLSAGLRTAADGLDWLKCHEDDARRFIAWELREAYPEPVPENEFARGLGLVRVGFEEDGTLLLYYDPGELFDGQLIEAEFSPNGTFLGADLVG